MKTKKPPAQTALLNDPDSASSSALPSTLRDDLRALGLVYMEAHAAAAAQEAARSGTAHLVYLEALAAGESAAQHDRTVARRLAAARFPVLKTMAGWNWSWPKKINRMQVEHLLQLGFLQTCANVILLGPTGVGKTHLACALGHAACLQRHPVLYASAIDVVNRLSAAHSANQLASEIKRYQAPRLLILDELGYLPLDKRGGEFLFQVISKRYERGSTIITTNIAFKDWPNIFAGDATMTSALLDRLLHHADTLLIEGESFRCAKSK
jgi:DNA replication protein DnaC